MSSKISIVVSEFNKNLTDLMLESARSEIESLGFEVAKVVNVPGAFDIPFAVNKVIDSCDGMVVLGVVLQGETDHDSIIVNAASSSLLELSIKNNKPIGFGIIGPKVTREQAEKRTKEYAVRAVRTVESLLKIE